MNLQDCRRSRSVFVTLVCNAASLHLSGDPAGDNRPLETETLCLKILINLTILLNSTGSFCDKSVWILLQRFEEDLLLLQVLAVLWGRKLILFYGALALCSVSCTIKP